MLPSQGAHDPTGWGIAHERYHFGFALPRAHWFNSCENWTFVSRSPDAEQRFELVLEEGLERIDTPQVARAVVARVERLSAGSTEEERGRAAAEQTRARRDQANAAATTIERAAAAARPEAPAQAVATVLDTVAAQSVAPSQAAEPVVEAAQKTLTPGTPVSPRARRGRRLLKEAALQRMGPLNALDARIYL